jgi:FAD-linked oxidoreductase
MPANAASTSGFDKIGNVTASFLKNRHAPCVYAKLWQSSSNEPTPDISRIRCVGAGHSFNGQCTTEGTLLALDNLSGLVGHNNLAYLATVKAGTRLQQLGQLLEDIGQDMVNIPDVNKQTLAGAISTGTHGSGHGLPALHGRVQSFRLIDPARPRVKLQCQRKCRNLSCRFSRLGCVWYCHGIHAGKLAISPYRTPSDDVALEQMLAEWPAQYAKNRNAEFFYIPFTGLAMRVLHNQTDKAVTARGEDKDMESLMDLKKLRDYVSWSPSLRRRVANMVADNHGTEYAVDYGWKLLASERSVRFHEMEYHLPLEAQLDALKEVIAVIESQRPDVFFPIEARVIQGDDRAWLSPFYQRDTGSIAVHAYYEDDYQFLYDLVEPILKKHGGRPHWGKLHSLTEKDFVQLYPQWQQVKAIRQQLDPQGKLVNPYANRAALPRIQWLIDSIERFE